MIIKNPKPPIRKWIKRGALIVFGVEALSFAGSYFIWYKLNTERDFRRYVHEKFPLALEYYYKTGELLDSTSNIRQIDKAYWEQNK